jgi:rRNA pseudouridine-1189 N-methylase Emg1 (Nep1/Mra1 family)
MEGIDMAGNINDLMNMYQQFKSNPMQMLSRRFNIPQDMNNPNDIVQHLLNTGQITQSQVNNVMNMRNSPLVQKLMGK